MEDGFLDKQGFVMGLIMGCPFITPVPDCPARELRQLSNREKVDALNRMSEPDLDAIIKHHNMCIGRRF